jgi:hypothetical protein
MGQMIVYLTDHPTAILMAEVALPVVSIDHVSELLSSPRLIVLSGAVSQISARILPASSQSW